MSELDKSANEREPLDLSRVDTYVFDYGGVVSFHYCEPWQSNLSNLLGVSPEEVRALLSESGELGREYRLGNMSRDDFWKNVIATASGNVANPAELEWNWAMTYQIDPRMLELIGRLRSERGAQVGILSNSDQYRQEHNEREYMLSQHFDFMISSHTHKVVKPDTQAYIKMLEAADRIKNPGKVLYIDDREKNVKPGYFLGIQGYVFNDYEDFAKLLHGNRILNIPAYE